MRESYPIIPIEEMGDLINKKKFYKARLKAEDFLIRTTKKDSHYDVTNADFWYLYGLTVRLTNHDDAVLSKIRKIMRICPNYSKIKDGDWLRDDATRAAYANKLELAQDLLIVVRDMHRDDSLRLTLVTSLEATVAYLSRQYDRANQLYRLAANIDWPSMAKSWHMNNHLMILKCLVADGCKSWQRQVHATIVLDNDDNIVRRIRVVIINTGGRFGNFVDDILVRVGLV